MHHHKDPIGSLSDAKLIRDFGQYTLSDVVGEGRFSVVRLATDNTNHVKRAVKIIPRSNLNVRKIARQYRNEIKANRVLHHPGIVQMHEVYKDCLFHYIVMDYHSGGTLFQRMCTKKKMSVEEARHVLKELLITLSYIHSLGICHRDLKPENILIDETGKHKICDFGLAWFADRDGKCKGADGTPGYMSPESLSEKPYDGKKSDIWSLGIVFHLMVTGRLPWSSWNPKQMANQLLRGRFDIPTSYGKDVTKILSGMLTMDPEQRITVDALLADPWLRDVD